MAVKTNAGLVAYALAQLGEPYWYGTFGQTATANLLAAKRRQYPDYYNQSKYKVRFDTQFGRRVHDCAGLIKGYLMSDTPTSAPKYIAALDQGSKGMLDSCSEKGAIGTMPDLPGVLVFFTGHVGVYVGGGDVVEARGHDYGVVKTQLRSRPWTHWGKHPAIAYAVPKPAQQAAPAVPCAGQAVTLRNAKLYAASSASIPVRTLTGVYYLYDGKLIGNRYRITNRTQNAGKSPPFLYVTGWIDKEAGEWTTPY